MGCRPKAVPPPAAGAEVLGTISLEPGDSWRQHEARDCGLDSPGNLAACVHLSSLWRVVPAPRSLMDGRSVNVAVPPPAPRACYDGGVSALGIRYLEASDEPDWRRLWTLYLEFYETSVTETVYQTTFARLLSGGPHEFRGLIALRGRRPVGIAHYFFHRHCWRVENVCYLQDLYVDAAERGTGVGRALIEAVYDRIGELTPFIRYNRRLA